MRRSRHSSLCALALLALGGTACTSAAYDSGYYDPYVYYTYYPTDVYYSSYYWADPYYYYYSSLAGGVTSDAGIDAGGITGVGGSTGAGGSGAATDGGSTVRQSVGDFIRALARGEDVCGNQVTVTPKTAANPCAATGAATIRSGVTIVFAGCQLSNGGKLDGTIDVDSTRTASDTACNTGTTITVSHTTTITDLVYTGKAGRRFVIPTQTGSGMTTFVNGQPPTAAVASTFSGQMQIFAINATTPSNDQKFNGDVMLAAGANGGSYVMNGTVTLNDQLKSGTTTLTAAGITRSSDCCRPTSGTITYVRTGTNPGGPHTWSFHPGCGISTFDGSNVDVAPCP